MCNESVVSADECAAAGGVPAAGWGSGCSGPKWAAGIQSPWTGSKRLCQHHTVTRRRQQQSQLQTQDLHTVTHQTDIHSLKHTAQFFTVCICVSLFCMAAVYLTLYWNWIFLSMKKCFVKNIIFKWIKIYLSSSSTPIFLHFVSFLHAYPNFLLLCFSQFKSCCIWTKWGQIPWNYAFFPLFKKKK